MRDDEIITCNACARGLGCRPARRVHQPLPLPARPDRAAGAQRRAGMSTGEREYRVYSARCSSQPALETEQLAYRARQLELLRLAQH